MKYASFLPLHSSFRHNGYLTWNYLINKVHMSHSSTRLVSSGVTSDLVLCINTFVAFTVNVEPLCCVCSTPALSVELNPKERITFVGCSRGTSTNETKKRSE